jgi:T5SS/PEP-CTERM-associated repeat protein
VSSKFYYAAVAGVVLGFANSGGRAADRFWTNSAGGNFTNAVNWSPNVVPGAADNAHFNVAGVPTVGWTVSRTNGNAFLNPANGAVQFAIGANAWFVTNQFRLSTNPASISAALVLSGNLIVANAAGTGLINVGERGKGTLAILGGSVTADQLLATNVTASVTNSVLTFSSGNLTVQHGSTVLFKDSQLRVGTGSAATTLNLLGTNVWGLGSAGTELVIGSSNTGPTAAFVVGQSTVWSNRARIILGTGNSAAAQLFVYGGAKMSSDIPFISRNSTATNMLVITDPGTLWEGTYIYVGDVASTNAQLYVTNGAEALLSNDLEIGNDDTAVSNLVMVAGPGSVLSNTYTAYVGIFGGGNQLTISNQGAQFTGNSYVGLYSSGNRATVTGTNSLWRHTSSLVVGSTGSSNRLEILNGGTVISPVASIGSDHLTISNQALVSGAGSQWIVTNSLFAGAAGRGHTLIISNQGGLQSGTAIVGNSSATNSRVILTGTGSSWTNDDLLVIGKQAVAGLLRVQSNAVLQTLELGLGTETSARSNTVEVFNGGRMDVLDRITLGSTGAVSRITLSNGTVTGGEECFMGASVSSTNNELLITSGSTWSNRFAIWVGYISSFNRLQINGGSLVQSSHGLIGVNPNANENEALVDGAGTVWSNQLGVVAGWLGSSNRLMISNGALVHSSDVVQIGIFAGSSNNLIQVDNGTLRATNVTGSAALRIGRGTNRLNAGRIETDQLIMTNSTGVFEFNGGLLVTRSATISNNTPFVVGRSSATRATWDVRASGSNHLLVGSLFVGSNSAFNQLVITNGATFSTLGNGEVGVTAAANSNSVLVSSPGSRWILQTDLHLGTTGAVNRLVISNGGFMGVEISVIGASGTSSNNEAVITGTGSLWTNIFLFVGSGGVGQRLVVSNGATVFANGLTVGATATATNNRVVVDGGTLRVTNGPSTGLLDIRRGTNVLNAGLVEVDRLFLTNSLGFFELNGGVLSARTISNSTATVFRVGNGTSAATLNLAGNASHFFMAGLSVSNNGTLSGNGTVTGAVSVRPGGTLAPGTGIGRIVLNSAPSLQGQVVMEISKAVTVLTNDVVQVSGTITYGGSLVVTNVGPSVLSGGDRFQLFAAGGYAGSFSPVILPQLSPGLTWTNKLLLDGSIEVLGRPSPHFANVIQSGTNVVISGAGGPTNATYFVLASTNITLPLTNWTRILTNTIDGSGNFTFTTPLTPGLSQRFYVLLVP